MKVISIICLLITGLAAISCNQQTTDAREFLKGMFSILNGKDWKLDDLCLGDGFEKNVQKIFDAISAENILGVLTGLKDLAESTKKDCPVNDLITFYKDTKALIDSGAIFSNLMAHTTDLMRLAKEEVAMKNTTPFHLGELTGKLAKIVVYNTSHNFALTFLGEEDSVFFALSSEGVDDFLEGLLEGLSKVPYAENKCAVDIVQFKPRITAVFKLVLEAIKTRQNVVEVFGKIYELVHEMWSIDANCHFKELSINLISLTTKIGAAKLLYRLSTHASGVYKNINDMVKFYEAKDYKSSGVSFGKFIQIAFNYSTQ